MTEEKSLIEKLKIVLGLVELEKEEEKEVEENLEEKEEEKAEEENLEEEEKSEEEEENLEEEKPEEEEEEVKAALTPEEQTAIVSELMSILEPRIAALEEAILMMGKEYKKENEELKSQVQKLSAEPGGAPVKAPLQLPDADNALSRIAKNKRK